MNYASSLTLLNKFNHDPAKAFACGNDTFAAFQAAWETVYPGEYWRTFRRARADGGTMFHHVDTNDIDENPAISPGYGQ